MMQQPTLGQINFEAYLANGGALMFHGRFISDWQTLSPMMQEAWYQAALVIVEQVFKDRQAKRIAVENVLVR